METNNVNTNTENIGSYQDVQMARPAYQQPAAQPQAAVQATAQTQAAGQPTAQPQAAQPVYQQAAAQPLSQQPKAGFQADQVKQPQMASAQDNAGKSPANQKPGDTQHIPQKPVRVAPARPLAAAAAVATEIQTQKKILTNARIQTVLIAVICAVIIASAIIIIPPVSKAVGSISNITTEIETKTSEITDIISDIGVVVKGIENVDFDSLNSSIEDLSKITSGLASVFSIFGGN